MASDTEKLAAATLAAAILQPAQGSGDVGGLEKAQAMMARRAAALYREILAAIADPPR